MANKEIRHAKKCFYKKQIEEASADQRATWKILNDLMGKQSDSIMVSELRTDSATLTRPEEIADFLNCHFTTMGPRLASEIPSDQINKKPEDYLTKHSASFQFKNISPSKVLKLLSSVKIAKATGLDKISNKILKLAAPVIYKSLTDLLTFPSPRVNFLAIGRLQRSVRPLNPARNAMPITIDLYRFYQALLVFLKEFSSNKFTVTLVIINCFILANPGSGRSTQPCLPYLT